MGTATGSPKAEAPKAEAPKSVGTPLELPAFRRFVAANLISVTGSAMAPLALAYAVIEGVAGPGRWGSCSR